MDADPRDLGECGRRITHVFHASDDPLLELADAILHRFEQ